ncbi:putative imidazolonepropionase isoform X2 [Penaeus vannamei]|uniref:Putative imidazolonepropionase isoform X2 n=1 Tax=Penaeus vannamei TaxID=6689 RepID=A0A3R7SQF5_PENVA|nr:putative imidazolonepropionase isoform X2 [Penaeus vannamei]
MFPACFFGDKASSSSLSMSKTIQFAEIETRLAVSSTFLAQAPRLLPRPPGTTLVECKSGYGLDVITELKMLRVLERARPRAHLTISSTFCGAHSVPRGMTADEATRSVIKDQIPAVAAAVKSGELKVDSIDVFCEKGVFSVDQTKRILEAGKREGLLINFHAEELHPLKSAEMGAALGLRQ